MSDREDRSGRDDPSGATPDPGAEDRTAVALRDAVYDRVSERVDRSDFESVAHYVEFTMEEVLARVEDDRPTDGPGAADGPGERHPDGPDDEVENRLESLGYR